MAEDTSAAIYSLDDRYRRLDGQVLLTGVQALARLPLDQHRLDRRRGLETATYISGYEGSPLAGYDLELGRHRRLLDEHRVVFQPGLNEELAATAVAGSQLTATLDGQRQDGVVGMWYGKAPGLDRASDALRHANLMGASPTGGALALVGDDPAAKSSSVPSGSEFALADLALPILYPADAQDVLDLGLHGVALSRFSGLWAGMKVATAVADGACTVTVHPDRVMPVYPDREIDGAPFLHSVTAKLLQPTLGPLERDLHRARLELARRYAKANAINQLTEHGSTDRVGIVAAGKTWLDLRQALLALGLDDTELAHHGIRLLKLGMIHPLEPDIVDSFADGLDEIVVIEEKRAFVETAIKDLLYHRAAAPVVSGKTTPAGSPLLATHGELDPDRVADAVAGRLLAHYAIPSVQDRVDTSTVGQQKSGQARSPGGQQRIALPLVTRTPYFCSGCPHNTSTKPPAGSLVGGGIGCHAMNLMMDPAQVGEVIGLTQMGGEGAQWLGMAPFVDAQHLVQNIGDGTFHHSGSLAIRAAVAAGANITFRLLHNSAVAMTGGQRTVGALSVPRLTHLLVTEGVTRIIVTTEEPRRYRWARLAGGTQVWQRDRFDEAQRTLAAESGVTVLIHDQECAAEKRRKRKRGQASEPSTRVAIDERLCEGCGDCGQKSNCLSVQPVQTEFGRKTQIHQSSCNKDYSCLNGDCPSFLVVEPDTSTPRQVKAPALDAAKLPAPQWRVPERRFALRLAGIGGTGVITVAQILATAGVLAGKHVRGLDQTGLAQKGGAVVSDLKLAEEPFHTAGKLAAGECDLYLGCDLLVAADAANLTVAQRDRTLAVVSTAEVPTGQMVIDAGLAFPGQEATAGPIRAATRADDAVFVDTQTLSEQLFGDDQHANMMLVGAAYQAGALPLPSEAIEQAIRLNGAAVETNIQAFRRGRQAIADPVGLHTTVTPAHLAHPAPRPTEPEGATDVVALVGAEANSELARLASIRVPDLVEYHNRHYARSYAETVERVRNAEAMQVPGSTALAEGVARNLYKLMAYKDEYEVARLALRPDLQSELAAQFGPRVRYSWKLHPPLLRALGMQHKITLGPWFRPAFRVLRALRRVRGHAIDPFGHTRLRRMERSLITEYREVLEELITGLTSDNHATAVEIAELPDLVRGYEQVKLDNVELYHRRLTELRAKLRSHDHSTNQTEASVVDTPTG